MELGTQYFLGNGEMLRSKRSDLKLQTFRFEIEGAEDDGKGDSGVLE